MVTLIWHLISAFAFAIGVGIGFVDGHSHVAYSRASDLGGGNEDWMANLCDSTKISRLSIPGTHDTMADDNDGDMVDTQELSLPNQLKIGIRALDIRCKISGSNAFTIFHGDYYLSAVFGEVVRDIIAFLDAHPTEFVLMRVKKEDDDDSATTFATIFGYYFNDYSDYFYQPPASSYVPTVHEVRKKIVVLQNFVSPTVYGLLYGSSIVFDIQDDFGLCANSDLYDKWTSVKNQLIAANSGVSSSHFFVNYLSGATEKFGCALIFPYFVASGHSDPSGGAPRLSTGLTTPGWSSSYPDFPRTTCFIGICTISYEGTNILAYDYMNQLSFVGVVMADFPGKGLIERIIGKNGDALQSSPLCTSRVMQISCNSPAVTGTIASQESVLFTFQNDKVQDVTFTNCDSTFDPKLWLLRAGSSITGTAENSCDGDDCTDTRYACSNNYRETMTFTSLAAAEYQLKIEPFSGGGTFRVQAFCGLKGRIAINGAAVTGSIGSAPETVYYSLEITTPTSDVTFTDCDTAFDPKLFVLNSDFQTISDTACDYDHDDCSDDARYPCGVAYRETFTVPQLGVGRYFVALAPYDNGGSYDIKALQTGAADSPVSDRVRARVRDRDGVRDYDDHNLISEMFADYMLWAVVALLVLNLALLVYQLRLGSKDQNQTRKYRIVPMGTTYSDESGAAV